MVRLMSALPRIGCSEYLVRLANAPIDVDRALLICGSEAWNEPAALPFFFVVAAIPTPMDTSLFTVSIASIHIA